MNEDNKLEINFPEDILQQNVKLTITDGSGNVAMSKKFEVKHPEMEIKTRLTAGTYMVNLVSHHSLIAEQKITIK